MAVRDSVGGVTGFEKFNSLERARHYHEEMVKAGLAPRAGQAADIGLNHGGMAHAELSALRGQKHQVPPLPIPTSLGITQHYSK